MKNKIKFLIMDVDGTLTDGRIYMSGNGELFKTFNVKDGCGIKDILPQYGIEPIIITARSSNILDYRCKELNISELHQRVRDKFSKLMRIIQVYNDINKTAYTLSNCAYIGDDLLDLQCMIPIKDQGGLVGCPKDAVKRVIAVSDYIADHNGGDGAVRDFIEWITEKSELNLP